MYLSSDLRKDSGGIKDTSKLVSFLYQLMRDNLPTGDVEKIMTEIDKEQGKEIRYTNGWLAQYAKNIAKRLK
jgi:hypothetical protein